MDNLNFYKEVLKTLVDIKTKLILENIGLKFIDFSNEDLLNKFKQSNEQLLKENEIWKFIHFIKTIELKELFDNLIKLDKLVFNIDKITAYQSLIEEDENKWMRFVFSQLLKYWKDKDLINFKDYLELKEYELNHYINHPIQDLWFEIQEEIAWYLVDRNLNPKHPFWKEIQKNKLEEIFLNWSDYCDKELATDIIKNLKILKIKDN